MCWLRNAFVIWGLGVFGRVMLLFLIFIYVGCVMFCRYEVLFCGLEMLFDSVVLFVGGVAFCF